MNIDNNQFASASLTAGQLNAIVKKLGGTEKALAFLRGEITVSEPTRTWTEKDGIIYFSVTSNGKTGQEWMDHFAEQKIQVSDWKKQLLLSDDFNNSITDNITTEIAVLKGMLWNDSDRATKNIRSKAAEMNLSEPNPEVACLIRDKFSDQELESMGLDWIVAMHNPINDSDGGPRLLYAGRSGDEPCLSACYGGPGHRWCRGDGFAFSVSSSAAEAVADKQVAIEA